MKRAGVVTALLLGSMAAFLMVTYISPSDSEMSIAEKEIDSKKLAIHHLSETLSAKSEGPEAHAAKVVASPGKVQKAVDSSVPWAPSTESQRLSPDDPRSKPSVFAWLWKASDPVPVNVPTDRTSMQNLAGNGTETSGGSNITDAVSVEEASKENSATAKKELELSQDKEMRFFAVWTIAILVVLGVGLCSIKYARSILGGESLKRPPPPRPPQDGQGSYGAVGGQGYPPR